LRVYRVEVLKGIPVPEQMVAAELGKNLTKNILFVVSLFHTYYKADWWNSIVSDTSAA
jgi:hypothetical protein